MQKNTIIIVLISIMVLFSGCQSRQDISEKSENIFNVFTKTKNNILSSFKSETDPILEIPIKPEVYLNVPFAVQFPTGSLDDPYQEGCEEASIIMAKAYIDHDTRDVIPNHEINQIFLDMIDWQIENLGGHYDLDAKQTLKLMQDYYNISNGQVLEIQAIDDIKKYLSDDYIVIAPTYGMNLDNPHFTAPGPAYHMLVITGYDDRDFITNDPGIGVGRNYRYSYENLFNSIHDLPEVAKFHDSFIKNNHHLMQNTLKNIIIIK